MPLKYVADILQTEKTLTVEEYTDTHTHTDTHTNTHIHTHTHTHRHTHTQTEPANYCRGKIKIF